MNKMRTLKPVLIVIVLLFTGILQAQLSVNVHIGTPPPWAPAGHTDIRYYYLPDVEAYYDVQTSMFVYQNRKQWVRRSHLPAQYRNYNLYNGRKVMISDYRGNSPYTHFREHKVKYGRGNRNHSPNNMQMHPGKNHAEAPRPNIDNRRNPAKSHNNDKKGGDNRDNKDKNESNDRQK
ncbi:MAG: hypothetical protein H6Q17_2603 [Bacteroidetes bacterium]|nr:hypothetical protein [Bacteroidota bacterium]